MARIPEGVKSRSFTVVRVPLSTIESIALECLKQIAMEGREATQDELTAGIGSMNECGSTASAVVNRLVSKGYVEHVMGHPLQRGLWVKIVATGQVTAEPRNKALHWRYRTERCPAPAIHRITERNKLLSHMIENKAREHGRSLAQFLEDCVYVGFNEICREEE